MKKEQNIENNTKQVLNISVLTYSLFDVWQSKLEYANKHNLFVFSFHYENKSIKTIRKLIIWNGQLELKEI